jgi:hypothetical protein
LNKQPRTADEGWSSSLGVGRGDNNPSPKKCTLRITHERCFLWRQYNPEVNYSPIRLSGVGGVLVEELSRSRKINRDLLLGTWAQGVGGVSLREIGH